MTWRWLQAVVLISGASFVALGVGVFWLLLGYTAYAALHPGASYHLLIPVAGFGALGAGCAFGAPLILISRFGFRQADHIRTAQVERSR